MAILIFNGSGAEDRRTWVKSPCTRRSSKGFSSYTATISSPRLSPPRMKPGCVYKLVKDEGLSFSGLDQVESKEDHRRRHGLALSERGQTRTEGVSANEMGGFQWR